MLTFRKASLITTVMAAAIALLTVVSADFAWLFIPVVITYLALLVIGSVKICSGFYLQAICRLDTTENKICLTFDDGPDEETTPKILDILDSQNIKATFFIIGEKAERHREIVKEIHRKGHAIGIHSYSHAFFFDLYGKKKMERDLLKCEQAIFEITGEKPLLFRPPYGVTNPAMARVVKKLGYRVVGWSVRSFDTKINDDKKLVDRVIKGLQPGAIILLHDNQEITANVLGSVISRINERNFRFVRLNGEES